MGGGGAVADCGDHSGDVRIINLARLVPHPGIPSYIEQVDADGALGDVVLQMFLAYPFQVSLSERSKGSLGYCCSLCLGFGHGSFFCLAIAPLLLLRVDAGPSNPFSFACLSPCLG